MQSENERLKKWEADLEEKTAHSNLLKKRLREYESALDELIEYESQKRCNEFEKVLLWGLLTSCLLSYIYTVLLKEATLQ